MNEEYNYQIPNEGTTNYADQMNQNPQGQGAGPTPGQPGTRGRKKMPKAVGVICAGMVFGIVASVTFQASNVVADRLLGKSAQTNAAVQSNAADTKSINNTKLNQTTSTVTSDVSVIAENAMPSVVSITNNNVATGTGFLPRNTRAGDTEQRFRNHHW